MERILSHIKAVADCSPENTVFTYQLKILLEKYDIPDNKYDELLIQCEQNGIRVVEMDNEWCEKIDSQRHNTPVVKTTEEVLLNKKCRFIARKIYALGQKNKKWHGSVLCSFYLDRYKDMMARRICRYYSIEEIELLSFAFGFYKDDKSKVDSISRIMASSIDKEWLARLEDDVNTMIEELSCKPHGVTRYHTNIDFYN